MIPNKFKILLSVFLLFNFVITSVVTAQQCVLKVNGPDIYTPDNKKIVLRGVNAFTIFGRDEDGFPTFRDISSTGANISRIVWKAAMNDGTRMDPRGLETLIKECISRNMLAMPELHDATGKDGNSPEWNLIMDYWTSADVITIIKKYEKFILLNIANETFSDKVTQEWENLYSKTIITLRQAGYKCPLVIDAPRYGRYVEAIISNGKSLLESDPEHNIVFSWHPWNTFTVKSDIKNGIDSALEQNLCMIIGEFGQPGYYEKGDPDIPHYIMQYSQEKETGWISWEWYNKGEQHEHISNNPDDQCDGINCDEPAYTDFGKLVLFDHEASISKTAIKVDSNYFGTLTGCNPPTSVKSRFNSCDNIEHFLIFPNPASEKFLVENPGQHSYLLKIFDLSGKQLRQFAEKEFLAEFYPNLESGIYLVCITSSEQNFNKLVVFTN